MSDQGVLAVPAYAGCCRAPELPRLLTAADAPFARAFLLQANSVSQQALGNVRTVYAFNGQERTVKTYASMLDHPMKARRDAACEHGWLSYTKAARMMWLLAKWLETDTAPQSCPVAE